MRGEAMTVTFITGGPIFDGFRLHHKACVEIIDGQISAICADTTRGLHGEVIDLGGNILAPGFVDLQVNGGGGLQFNSNPSVQTLKVMSASHRSLGTTAFLPTLITDTIDITARAIASVQDAVQKGSTMTSHFRQAPSPLSPLNQLQNILRQHRFLARQADGFDIRS